MVDPDPEVLWAIKGDLQRQYEDSFDAASGLRRNGFETLKQLKSQRVHDTVCSGTAKVKYDRHAVSPRSLKLFPKAKRVLLTVYDTNSHSGSVAKKRWLSDRDILARFFKTLLLQRGFQWEA